jgi:hypothetical protein
MTVITNRPDVVVDDEILDVTNLAVRRLDVIPADFVSAPQMVIPRFFAFGGFPPFCAFSHEVALISPSVWAGPVDRPSIIPVIILLKLAGNGPVAVQGWTILDLFLG